MKYLVHPRLYSENDGRAIVKSMNVILITACDDYDVHANNQIDVLAQRVVLIKNRLICFTPKNFQIPG